MNIAWPWLALGMVLIISILTYFDVRISSMVLAIGLISEVVILLIFDGYLFARGHVTAAPLNPVNAFKGFPAEGKLVAGAIGIGLFFAFWSFLGSGYGYAKLFGPIDAAVVIISIALAFY